ncbi:DUF7848 domain-containing protein [Streptomyces sp. H27-D2]|uniref:DUF7848 domain-containing protein n=1 Tax=Streptomyces sp. H27-D2 TaxID=3046304 RepID=UPI002DBB8573|nr:hypothetical protein [Streptomyces sp. H27-D2]MEC4017773.1 hypothetical protein [Streptomyces sp. H27-D2]
MRAVMRYVPFATTQDLEAEPEYAAECVSGDEEACGETSGRRIDPARVEEWMRRHTQATRHQHYRRTFTDFAVMAPADELPAGLEPARVVRVSA